MRFCASKVCANMKDYLEMMQDAVISAAFMTFNTSQIYT